MAGPSPQRTAHTLLWPHGCPVPVPIPIPVPVVVAIAEGAHGDGEGLPHWVECVLHHLCLMADSKAGGTGQGWATLSGDTGTLPAPLGSLCSRAILVAAIEDEERVRFSKEVLLVQLVGAQLHRDDVLGTGTVAANHLLTPGTSSFCTERPCSPLLTGAGTRVLTRQLLSSSASSRIVPHRFPGTPLEPEAHSQLRDKEDSSGARSGVRAGASVPQLVVLGRVTRISITGHAGRSPVGQVVETQCGTLPPHLSTPQGVTHVRGLSRRPRWDPITSPSATNACPRKSCAPKKAL